MKPCITLSFGPLSLLLPTICVAMDIQATAISRQPQLPEVDAFIESHRDHQFQSRPVDTLGQTTEHWFTGSAADLNQFLLEACQLCQTVVVVAFTGPQGVLELEPLTPEAAQSSVIYDWKCQIQRHQCLFIVIPLASRIPFATINVPAGLLVEAYGSSPSAARQYARLHEVRRHIEEALDDRRH